MSYIIQYSHDEGKWFGFGASKDNPPTEYMDLTEAEKQFDHIFNRYLGLVTFIRIANKETGKIMKEADLSRGFNH